MVAINSSAFRGVRRTAIAPYSRAFCSATAITEMADKQPVTLQSFEYDTAVSPRQTKISE